ncbi:MAG: nucleoside-diphosphate sugar epimerase/dehydratase [Synechococcaceae cyanobacterium]|nr:nucleoside-diphosphate sugar epimerase/dehydratase [Synechococcaceae cyanobacterium]
MNILSGIGLRRPSLGLHREVLRRRLILLLLDGALIVASFWGAFALRLNDPLAPMLEGNLFLLPWAVGIGLTVLVLSGWYRGLTRYSGSHSLYGLLPRTGVACLLLLLVNTLSGNPSPPFRAFWILWWILFSGALITSRIVLRDLLRHSLARAAAPDRRPAQTERTEASAEAEAPASRLPTLLYGAGEEAHLLVSELRFHPRFHLLGVIDDDPALWGRRLGRLPIHSPADLPELIQRHAIRRVLLALSSASRSRRRTLVSEIRSLGPSVLTIPTLGSIASGEHAVTDLRPVAIEDLLGREPSRPDPELLRAAVQGRSVLVTGAGGSIGSELCRQILRLGPARLVLLERSEYGLYAVERDLQAIRGQGPGPWPEVRVVLGDVGQRDRLEALCRGSGVEVLFHAAAYKHVPMVESNLCAGVANNLLGTRSALEVAMACGMERFLLISTDKAVRPSNAMGASKRACELLVQDAAARMATLGAERPRLAMVRFGNVLGSSGSVVPLFEAQIASGGPVTVTHPEITRYFMTIPEAVQLVLQACGMARGGEVFLLDMGEPVRIVELARQMIRLSGSTVRDEENPEGEIPIQFTGLRPGEKLYEELLISENDEPTDHPLIRRAREGGLLSDRLAALMERMEVALARWDEGTVRAVLAEMVPEYRPDGGFSPGPPPTGDARLPAAAGDAAPPGA